jgi:rRNA maturation endonuclease Nob1
MVDMDSMSVREQRRQNAEVIAQCTEQLSQELDARTQINKALLLAHEVLSEEPRKLTECEIALEYLQINIAANRGHCSECDGAFEGWTEAFRFCPICGSQITRAARETNPHDRNLRERIKENLIHA